MDVLLHAEHCCIARGSLLYIAVIYTTCCFLIGRIQPRHTARQTRPLLRLTEEVPLNATIAHLTVCRIDIGYRIEQHCRCLDREEAHCCCNFVKVKFRTNLILLCNKRLHLLAWIRCRGVCLIPILKPLNVVRIEGDLVVQLMHNRKCR